MNNPLAYLHNQLLLLLLGMLTLVSATYAQGQGSGFYPTREELMAMGEDGQVLYLNQRLSEGLPAGKSDGVIMLILARSNVSVPVIESKIEQVLKSANPSECFTDRTVDPKRFVDVAAWSIPEAGDENALRAIGKLIALDEKRFGILVRNTMYTAQDRRNPFVIAYLGLELHDSAVEKRILAWAEEEFGMKAEYWQSQLRQWWAEGMVEKYHRAPTDADWQTDPIASRMRKQLSDSVHDEVIKLAVEAAARKQ